MKTNRTAWSPTWKSARMGRQGQMLNKSQSRRFNSQAPKAKWKLPIFSPSPSLLKTRTKTRMAQAHPRTTSRRSPRPTIRANNPTSQALLKQRKQPSNSHKSHHKRRIIQVLWGKTSTPQWMTNRRYAKSSRNLRWRSNS